MKIVAVEVCDIIGEPSINLEERHSVRFRDDQGNWIVVDVRDGAVTVRGSSALSIAPNFANQITVDLLR